LTERLKRWCIDNFSGIGDKEYVTGKNIADGEQLAGQKDFP